jgi:RTX calcium-binding nonapeptide repeat (4 copies)
MSYNAIITRGGIIVIELNSSTLGNVSNALSNVTRQIADDGARIADAWQNSQSVADFARSANLGDAVKVVGGVAFGAALTASVTALLAGSAGAIAVGVGAGFLGGMLYEKAFDGATGLGQKLADSIVPSIINNGANNASSKPTVSPFRTDNINGLDLDPLVPVAVPYDPIVFDLDGDGIETVGWKAGVKFDGNADGIKTTTGWVGKDDGMLVWDRNGNGKIDSGRELFGDQTVLANGQLAAHGFAALAEQDTNRDGKVNALDANFAQFKVWQDLNQDGISQANELFTLEQKGIKSVNVQASENANGGTAFDGGRITQTGSYTKTDGTTGTAGNLLFNQDNFHTEFVNKIAVSDAAKTITNWKGAGFVRDLQEAATIDASLIAKVAAVKAATTRAAYVQAVGELMAGWGATSATTQSGGQYSGMAQQARTVGQGGQMYELIARSPKDAQETSWLDVAVKGTEAARATLRGTLSAADRAKFDTMRKEMLDPIQHLQAYEAFTGTPILSWDAVRMSAFNTAQTMSGGGRATRIVMMRLSAAMASGQARIAGVTAGVTGYVTVSVASAMQQIGSIDLDSFWRNLQSNAADNMMGEYRLAPYLEKIDLVISTDGVKLDFTKLDAAITQLTNTSAYEGAALILDLKRVNGEMLNSAGWNLDTQVGKLAALAATNADVKRAFADTGLNLVALGQSGTAGDDIMAGNAQGNYLTGGAGNDLLYGDTGADTLYGEAGDDVLIGGKDADTLGGGAGNDTYVWAKGDGNDVINEYDTTAGNIDSLKLSDLNPADVVLGRDQYNLYVTVVATGERITVSNHFSGAAANDVVWKTAA